MNYGFHLNQQLLKQHNRRLLYLESLIGRKGEQQVYAGSGNPNDANLRPRNTSIPAIYNNTDVPGESWWWDPLTTTWY